MTATNNKSLSVKSLKKLIHKKASKQLEFQDLLHREDEIV